MQKTDSAALAAGCGGWDALCESFFPLLIASGIFALLVTFLRNKIPNLSVYVLACALFFAAYFASSFLAGGRLAVRSRLAFPAELAALLAVIILLALNFVREGQPDQGSDFNESLFRYQLPRPAYLLLLAATTALSYFLVWACRTQGRRPPVRTLASLPYIALLSCTVWVPNIFYSLHTFYHAHAYFSSLCDVLNLAPFGQLDTPYYGHFALFFLLPGKLLRLAGVPGNVAMASFVAASNFMTLLATLYVVDRFVRNDAVFFLMLLSLADPYLMMMPKLHFIKDVYLQMIPHRVLFPALISAFMVSSTGKPMGKARMAAAYALAALAIEWSTEIGLVCTATVALYVFLRGFDFSAPLSDRNLRRLALCAALALLSLLAAYLLVVAYDLVVGGQGLAFRDFMYPLVGTYKSLVPHGPLTWFPVVLFFLASVAVCAARAVRRREGREKDIGIASIAVLALGLLTYYCDSGLQVRLMIAFFQFIMVFSVLLDFLASGAVRFRTGAAFTIVALAVSSTFVLGNAGAKEVLTDRRATAWQLKSLSRFAQELDGEIPEGCLAFGWGVSDLFAAMGRDPGVHVIDWVNIASDKNPIFLAHVNGLLEGTDSFFAYEDSAALLPASGDFGIEKEFEYKGWKFALYRRK